jgi:hypothetical protein
MSEAATSADQPLPSRSGRLLALVQKVVNYGNQLIASFRQYPPSVHDTPHLQRTFGVANIVVILSRIALGVRRARFLADKITRTTAQLDSGTPTEPPPRAPTTRASATQRAPRLQLEEPEYANETLALLARLPNPDQIAASVRRKPIGAVLADICRDLGISRGHPLWDELHAAIVEFGGSLVRLFRDKLDQAFPIAHIAARLRATPDSTPEPDSTGPPPAPA